MTDFSERGQIFLLIMRGWNDKQRD